MENKNHKYCALVLESDVEVQGDNMLSDNDRQSLNKEHVFQIVKSPYAFSVCSIREYQSKITG